MQRLQTCYQNNIQSILKTTIMNTQEAISIIVDMQTLPPQIDYVSPGEKKKYHDAEDFIKALPTDEKIKAHQKINSEVSSYYKEDKNGISVAYMDSLF
jgi:hypothetical protein